MIKALLIDLDNTLYQYEPCHEKALKAAFSVLKDAEPKALIEAAFTQGRQHTHESLKGTAAAHNRLLYFQKTLDILGIKKPLTALAMYNAYWDTFIESMCLCDGVEEFLQKQSGKKLCLVTDMTAEIQYRKIKRLGLDKYFNCVITSEEAGAEKPSSIIFNLALQKINADAKEAAMIGDSFEKDVLGARAAGIKPFYFSPEGNTAEGAVSFKSFKELAELIK